MKLVYTGLESSGKSLMLSRVAEKIYRRNVMWLRIREKLKLQRIPRQMAFNQPMADWFVKKITDSGLRYKEFRNFNDVEYDTETDFFIDELLKIFPAKGTDPLPFHVMDFLTQGAKSGNNIYSASQDFSQVHKQFRLLTNKVYVVTKLFGSARPMKSSPPVGYIYGMGIKRSVKPQSFKGDNATMESNFIPLPFWISEGDTKRYDTLYKLPRAVLPDHKVRQQRVYAVDDNGQVIYEKKRYV